MSRLDDISPDVQLLLSAACDEDTTPEQLLALERVTGDEAAMRLLIDYLQLDAELHRLVRGESNADRCLDLLGIGSASEAIPETCAAGVADAL